MAKKYKATAVKADGIRVNLEDDSLDSMQAELQAVHDSGGKTIWTSHRECVPGYVAPIANVNTGRPPMLNAPKSGEDEFLPLPVMNFDPMEYPGTYPGFASEDAASSPSSPTPHYYGAAGGASSANDSAKSDSAELLEMPTMNFSDARPKPSRRKRSGQSDQGRATDVNEDVLPLPSMAGTF